MILQSGGGGQEDVGTMRLELVEVECYSGYRANERPVAFTFRGRRRVVSEVIDRWCEGGTDPRMPELDYFKVRADDGSVHFLRYNTLFDKWAVCLFEQQPRTESAAPARRRRSSGGPYR